VRQIGSRVTSSKISPFILGKTSLPANLEGFDFVFYSHFPTEVMHHAFGSFRQAFLHGSGGGKDTSSEVNSIPWHAWP
jgi:hypothetical protein